MVGVYQVVHIELRRWADCLVIAPCSAGTLSKVPLYYLPGAKSLSHVDTDSIQNIVLCYLKGGFAILDSAFLHHGTKFTHEMVEMGGAHRVAAVAMKWWVDCLVIAPCSAGTLSKVH